MIREFSWVTWVRSHGSHGTHGNGKHRLNLWEWEREWEWWTGNGNSSLKKFPLVALIIFLALYCRLAR